MTVDEVLKIAYSQIGIKENPPGSNCVKYNDWYYNKKGIKGSAYPWCCAFISWIFKDTNLVKKTASCSDMANWFKKQGRFYTKSIKPEKGDLVFFNFSHPNSVADHIGIVYESHGICNIKSIEGNTSVTSNDNGGAVMLRNRTAFIVGYGRPDYYKTKTTNTKVLKIGSKGNEVKELHKLLRKFYFNTNESNATFDSFTDVCVRTFQKMKGLVVDGEVGPKTWEELRK